MDNPATAHPPTLLVPGWHHTASALRRCQQRLIDWGWPAERVAALSFHDRHGSNIEHAAEIAAAVSALSERAAGEDVAVVAHSMGGLALREYLTTIARPRVRIAIFVGTPHRGTWAAYLAWGGGAREMRPGSAFLQTLNARTLPRALATHCIATPIDTRVLPGSSAFLRDADCHRVLLPTHPRMLRHPATLRLIRDLLLRHRG